MTKLLVFDKSKDIGKAENVSLFLVFWTDWESEIDSILDKKEDKTALIIYAPPRSIPQEQMVSLDDQRNVTVTNFRGRLLNDIVVSIITRSSTP